MFLARVVQVASALLLAYGTSYGPRPGNLVFVFGAALTALMTIAIFSRERNWLRAIWPAILGFAILFAASGFRVLGLPTCESGLSGYGSSDTPFGPCAGSASHEIAIAAIVLVGAALVAAVVDWRRSVVTTA